MLIQRCAWHAFFRGYPRPLRVLSWHGRGIAFSDTICPSCAERVRIEGLWGSAPPTPVWPGAPQTALIFVGLPLLTALVLLATPLHDAGPPPPREEVAAPLGNDVLTLAPGIADSGTATAAMPHAVARRAPTRDDGVPAVIYETRGIIHQPREHARPAAGAAAPATTAERRSGTWLRSVPTPEALRLAAATARTDARATAASIPQSP